MFLAYVQACLWLMHFSFHQTLICMLWFLDKFPDNEMANSKFGYIHDSYVTQQFEFAFPHRSHIFLVSVAGQSADLCLFRCLRECQQTWPKNSRANSRRGQSIEHASCLTGTARDFGMECWANSSGTRVFISVREKSFFKDFSQMWESVRIASVTSSVTNLSFGQESTHKHFSAGQSFT